MEVHKCPDILHPLATLYFGQERPYMDGSYATIRCKDNQAVILGDKVFTTIELLSSAPVFACSSISGQKLWTKLSTLDIIQHALTTYRSKLVLVGGRTYSDLTACRELWTSEDGISWQPSLLPMPTCRYGVAAISTGSPEYLIVAGGYGNDNQPVDNVEVLLVEEQWVTVESLPYYPHGFYMPGIHNGNVYLVSNREGYYCKLSMLLSAIAKVTSNKEANPTIEETAISTTKEANSLSIATTTSDKDATMSIAKTTSTKEPNLWQVLPLAEQQNPRRFIHFNKTVFPFGHHLVGLDGEGIHAYYPPAQCWVHVGDIPYGWRALDTALAISADEMIYHGSNFKAVRTTLRMSPYNPDSLFSKSALSRLELAGMPVLTELDKQKQQLAIAIGVKEHSDRGYFGLIKDWIHGDNDWLPPSWRSLYKVLRELGHEELSQQIEDYLSCPRSLNEQCTSVIIHALLQQSGSLEPDQLHVRLPDYVPTTVKHSLTHTFKAYTHQLPPLSAMASGTPSPPQRKRQQLMRANS